MKDNNCKTFPFLVIVSIVAIVGIVVLVWSVKSPVMMSSETSVGVDDSAFAGEAVAGVCSPTTRRACTSYNCLSLGRGSWNNNQCIARNSVAHGATCTSPSACVSNWCVRGVCVALPDEANCISSGACASNNCVDGVCAAAPSTCRGPVPQNAQECGIGERSTYNKRRFVVSSRECDNILNNPLMHSECSYQCNKDFYVSNTGTFNISNSCVPAPSCANGNTCINRTAVFDCGIQDVRGCYGSSPVCKNGACV